MKQHQQRKVHHSGNNPWESARLQHESPQPFKSDGTENFGCTLGRAGDEVECAAHAHRDSD